MGYHEIFPVSRPDLNRLLDSGNEQAIYEALLSASFYDLDWEWVQNRSLFFLDHPDRDVRRVAATCLGHVARVHKKLDTEVVLPRLYEARNEPSIAGEVEDAIEDIRLFIRLPIQ